MKIYHQRWGWTNLSTTEYISLKLAQFQLQLDKILISLKYRSRDCNIQVLCCPIRGRFLRNKLTLIFSQRTGINVIADSIFWPNYKKKKKIVIHYNSVKYNTIKTYNLLRSIILVIIINFINIESKNCTEFFMKL